VTPGLQASAADGTPPNRSLAGAAGPAGATSAGPNATPHTWRRSSSCRPATIPRPSSPGSPTSRTSGDLRRGHRRIQGRTGPSALAGLRPGL